VTLSIPIGHSPSCGFCLSVMPLPAPTLHTPCLSVMPLPAPTLHMPCLSVMPRPASTLHTPCLSSVLLASVLGSCSLQKLGRRQQGACMGVGVHVCTPIFPTLRPNGTAGAASSKRLVVTDQGSKLVRACCMAAEQRCTWYPSIVSITKVHLVAVNGREINRDATPCSAC